MVVLDVADGSMQLTHAQATRIGALASGGGRTVVNIASACQRGEVNAQVVVCVVTRGDAGALERCLAHGIAVEIVAPEPAATFDDRVDAVLARYRVEFVCLAGYLRHFRVNAWAGRTLNIHPALLPDFGGQGMYGMHVHRAVLAAGARESGCTVHWVNGEYDRGETLLQRSCPVEPGDTPETLASRVFQEECLAYPQALQRVLGRGAGTGNRGK